MNFLKTAIATIILLTSITAKVDAAVLSANFIENEVKKDILEKIQPNIKGKYQIKLSNVPYSSIKTKSDNYKIITDFKNDNLKSLMIVQVKIYSNEERVASFGLRAELSLYEKVWVAKDWIRRGETLSGIELIEKEIDPSDIGSIEENFDITGYMAKRNIRPGEVIKPQFLEKIPVIMKDSPVSLIFKTENVSITIPATAMMNGNIGEFIKVRSKNFKKTYLGKVIKENIVLVNI